MARDMTELLDADEGVVLETRQHWFVLVRALGVLVLAMALTGVAVWYADRATWLDNSAGEWAVVGLWVLLAGLALVALWRLLGWVTERFYVTTSKVVYVHGVLNRSVTSTPLVKIDEVTLRRPFVGRLFGFGRLDVGNAAGGTEPLAGLEYLPRPARLYQLIGERSRAQRMVEGGAHRDEDGDGLVDRGGRRKASDAGDEWRPSGDATSGG